MGKLSISEVLDLGIEAHRAGNVREADRYYTAILKLQPNHPDANHNLGVLALSIDEAEQSIPFLRRAVEAYPKEGQFWLSLIEALLKLEKYENAKIILKQACQNGFHEGKFSEFEKKLSSYVKTTKDEDKKSDPPLNEMDDLLKLYNEGLFENCVDRCDSLLERFPLSATVYNIHGAAYAGCKQYKTAIESYTKAIKINSNYTEAYNNMGNAQNELGDSDEARKSYIKALEIDPTFYKAHFNVGVLNRDKSDNLTAIKNFQEALKFAPNFLEAHLNLGNAYKENGNFKDAIKVYKKVLRLKGNYTDALYNMGNTFYEIGNLKEAIKYYEKVLSVEPDHSDAYNNMATVFKSQGKFDRALESYKKALEINPKLATAQHMIDSLLNKTTKAPPREYVETLFDGYANKFDVSLVKKLQYQTPKELVNLVLVELAGKKPIRVLDIGCGTGLIGPEIKPYCKELVGVDLSQKMLEQARLKNTYDRLEHADINNFLSTEKLIYDLFISTDVFIYLGDLSKTFEVIKKRNQGQALFAFSTEHFEGKGFRLERSGRYSHSKDYIFKLSDKYGYKLKNFSLHKLRKEKDEFLLGGYYILEI